MANVMLDILEGFSFGMSHALRILQIIIIIIIMKIIFHRLPQRTSFQVFRNVSDFYDILTTFSYYCCISVIYFLMCNF